MNKNVTNTRKRIEQRGSIIAMLRNRFSVANIFVYLLLAIGAIVSLIIGAEIAAAVAAVGAGAVILVVALDMRIHMKSTASVLIREMREARREANGSHDYAVRVESRAKFRYDRISGTLAEARSENVLQRAALNDLLGVVASIPEPVTEEILKKRLSGHSSRLNRLLGEKLEAQGLSADAQRRSEIEDMRNIILSALAIQRAELNILTDRLLETSPRA